jgi:DNA-binding beta-propeller fold protein YncE
LRLGIYVANCESDPSCGQSSGSTSSDVGSVTAINGATNATVMLIDPKAVTPIAVAVNSATNKIYVANSGSSNVTVIDGVH